MHCIDCLDLTQTCDIVARNGANDQSSCLLKACTKSSSSSGHTMEGTRLTIVKVPTQPDAFEFSIRTPVTPPRWKDFDQVMALILLTLVSS